MTELKNIRFSFLAIAFLICNLIVLPFDFFVQIKFTIPFWTFYLLEICFVFLILFATFPKTPLLSIAKVSASFLAFMSFCFVFQGFLPFAAEHKILAFEVQDSLSSVKIIINLVGLLVIHVLGAFLFASELLRNDEDEVTEENVQGSTLQYQREISEAQEFQEQILQDNTIEYDQESIEQYEEYEELGEEVDDTQNELDLKDEVSSLFDIYLDDYENNQEEAQQKLSNMEEVLLSNLKEGVTGAMCLNAQGEELHDEVFHWQGFDKQKLIELFKANDDLCRQLDEGNLCQVLFSDTQHWYLIAKYRGNYLLLQTDDKEPDELIENGFYLVQAIREHV